MLGAVLLGQNKLAEAEPLLVKGYEGMKDRKAAIPPQAEVRISEALERLVELYSALERPDNVIHWLAELDRQKKKSSQPDSPKASPPDDNQPETEAAKDDGN
jgi:hypothetical protein